MACDSSNRSFVLFLLCLVDPSSLFALGDSENPDNPDGGVDAGSTDELSGEEEGSFLGFLNHLGKMCDTSDLELAAPDEPPMEGEVNGSGDEPNSCCEPDVIVDTLCLRV